MKSLWRIPLLAVGLTLLGGSALRATPGFLPEASAYHVYVDSTLLIAFELTPSREAFLEVINLGENRRCLSVERIFLRTAEGQPRRFDAFLYDGRKSKLDGNPRACVRQRTRRKFELGYSFAFPEQVRKVVFLLGRLAYRLQPVSGADYRKFVENFDEINIGVSSDQLKYFQLRVLYGKTFYGSRIRCRPVTAPFVSKGTRGPVTLLSTFPRRTEKARKKKKTGSVSIALKLDASGEVVEAVPESSLEFGLTERALYEVKHWWDFAPAYRDGKPVAGDHRAKVVYRLEQDDWK
ncbi:MAG: energy transducer TonB [Acidobacteriota bacterium]|nr:energy transducer TonB [Acidobacteriota bacterium]